MTDLPLRKRRRRKSSAPTTELIAASVAEELKLTTVTCPEIVPASTRSVCFSEPPNESHQESQPNENGAVDASRVEYVSDESGSSWHVLEKSTSHNSRPDISSQSPRSALADFGYAESAVGISQKASPEITNSAKNHISDQLRSLDSEILAPLYAQPTPFQAEKPFNSQISL